MRTTAVTTTNVNEIREAYVAPQVEVIEMEAEGVIAGSPGAGDNGDPDIGGGGAYAPCRDFWE